jgi:hypothetical protein
MAIFLNRGRAAESRWALENFAPNFPHGDSFFESTRIGESKLSGVFSPDTAKVEKSRSATVPSVRATTPESPLNRG